MTIRTLLGFAFLSLAAVSVVLAGPRSARADSVPPSSKPLARRVLSPPTKVPPAPAKLYSLADVAAGERLVVVVMKGSWCQVCVRQLAELAKRKPALDKLGVRVVGLNTDPPGHNADVMRRHKLPFPILSDPRHVVIGALGAWRADWGHALPSIVVFDRCGKERGRLNGRRPGMRPEAALMALLRAIAQTPESCQALPAA